jgi:sterol desaturase/sphingolipid hydroxylase (fatty acid hydroxylase superfamily)
VEVTTAILPPPVSWAGADGSPWVIVRGLLFFVLSDLTRYLAHRALHESWLWPSHRFHHSVSHLDWYAGNRAAPVHAVLFVAPTVVLAWGMQVGLVGVALNAALGVVWNHVMHTNLRIPEAFQRAAEHLVTTPRYHHIHHSNDPALGRANLGSILTLWDRLFGTYLDPDRVPAETLEFGLLPEEQRPLWRLMIGL